MCKKYRGGYVFSGRWPTQSDYVSCTSRADWTRCAVLTFVQSQLHHFAMAKSRRGSSISTSFATELAVAQRQALLDLVREKPGISIDELIREGVDGVGALTVGELVSGRAGLASSGRGRGRSSAGSRGARRGGGTGKTLDLRSEDAKVAYDNAVLDAIQNEGGEAKAEAIRAAVGGTPTQLRTSLERWMAEGGIKKKGEKRATVYRVA